MNRRSLLKRLGAAVVAAPALAVTATKPAEASDAERLLADVLANPGRHPEIEARARELLGETGAEAYQRSYDEATARAESQRLASKLYESGLVSYREFAALAGLPSLNDRAELERVPLTL